MIYALDPGKESALIAFDGRTIHFKKIMDESELLSVLRRSGKSLSGNRILIELIGHYGKGMPAGRDVFDTCILIGRCVEICEAHNAKVELVLRATIKANLCGKSNAKDSNVRQALIDRYSKETLKGVVKHLWAAMAVADYAYRCPTIIATANNITATASNG